MPQRPIRTIIENQQIVATHASTTVAEAARLMKQSNVGALMVVERGRLVGIFTERDALFRVVAEERDPSATPLSSVMTAHPQTIGPDKPLKRASDMKESERVTFSFNPTAPEEWRSTAPVVMQLYASQLMSQEEARERLGLGPVKKGETFAPDPTQMTPGQANKITTNPRKTGGIDNPKGLVSKPPEQQEKPEEVASGTSGLSMPQLVGDKPVVQPLGQPKKKKAKAKRRSLPACIVCRTTMWT